MNARLNITFNGQNGYNPDPVPFDLDDATIRQIATEAVSSGYVPGIDAVNADFSSFVVDRFPEKDGEPNKIMLRPKTAFGA